MTEKEIFEDLLKNYYSFLPDDFKKNENGYRRAIGSAICFAISKHLATIYATHYKFPPVVEVKENLEQGLLPCPKAILEIYNWQYNYSNSFTNVIFNLFHKADGNNLYKLTKGFPEEAVAYKEWRDSDSQDEFFAKYGLRVK